jgi:hypothetical protein
MGMIMLKYCLAQRSKMKAAEVTLVSGLVTSVSALCWSSFGTSIGAALVLVAFLISAVRGELLKPKNTLIFWGLVGGFVWGILGLIWTQNLPEGLATLQVKLPLLIFPLALFTVNWESGKWGKVILKFFILSSFMAALAGIIWGYYHAFNGGEIHPKIWSPFISHIRMGVILAVGWGILLLNKKSLYAIIYGAVALLSIWHTASVTGILMLAITCVYFFISIVKTKYRRRSILLSCITSLVGLFAFVFYITPTTPYSLTTLPSHTPWGSPYEHNLEKHLEENGYKVWNFIAIDEMRHEWNLRSEVPFDSLDGNGHTISTTAIRYLTSMNLPKNGLNIKNLSEKAMRNIEAGHTSIRMETLSGLSLRLDVLRFEVGNYLDGGNPSGNSVTQRFEFMKTGVFIVKSKGLSTLLFGVGTGDLPDSYEKAYLESNSLLDKAYWKRTHNQYLAWWVGLGLIGLVFWLITLYASLLLTTDVSRLSWLLLVICCLAEDTLETQAGVTFAVLILTVFIPNQRK